MAQTFAQLGIPFPLFAGPSDQATEYCGIATCSLCGGERTHCFRLDIGCAVIRACPSCSTENGLDANDRADRPCRVCKQTVPFPDLGETEIKACYACLRSGKAAITKDTELGMISWEQAFEGITHGLPGLIRDDFEMVATDDDWVGARLPQGMMFELLRTPNYDTIQGECWQFCCQQPMVFVGEWNHAEFSRRSPDGDGWSYFEKIVQNCGPDLWDSKLQYIGFYVFRCNSCGRLTAHWDFD